MKKLFTFAVFTVLSCLLGNNVLAQNRNYMTMAIDTIDFTGWAWQQTDNYGKMPVDAEVSWSNNSTTITQITGTATDGSNLTRNNYSRVTVEGSWTLYGSDTFEETYLQKRTNGTAIIYISNVKVGDVITIYGEGGNANGGCRVVQGDGGGYGWTVLDNTNQTCSYNMQFNAATPYQTFVVSQGILKNGNNEPERLHFNFITIILDYAR